MHHAPFPAVVGSTSDWCLGVSLARSTYSFIILASEGWSPAAAELQIPSLVTGLHVHSRTQIPCIDLLSSEKIYLFSMAYFQPDYFPGFIAPPAPHPPPPHSYVHPPPSSPGSKAPPTPPPAPHSAAPPPSHIFPSPSPHVFPPPPHHTFPPLPPHVYPQPPPFHPNIPPPAPAHHPTVIIVVFASLGGLFFLAFLSLALCCFIKKRKKQVEKSEIINVEEHFKVQEAIVPGPHGQETVVLSIEEDIKFEEKVKKNEKLSEADEGAVTIHGEPSHFHSSDLLHIKHKA
ncbi:hypothetical protein EJ110_NYTH38254 [Nymphaea thermarum]|nr:hypothetical protein EJ110_NYTH38254 [Nymphaea thermarum]